MALMTVWVVERAEIFNRLQLRSAYSWLVLVCRLFGLFAMLQYDLPKLLFLTVEHTTSRFQEDMASKPLGVPMS